MSSTETRLDEAVRQTTLAETELLLQMGRLDLAEKVKVLLRAISGRPLTPEEAAIRELLIAVSSETLTVLDKVEQARSNPDLAAGLRRLPQMGQ
jgi:hypothetical protein